MSWGWQGQEHWNYAGLVMHPPLSQHTRMQAVVWGPGLCHTAISIYSLDVPSTVLSPATRQTRCTDHQPTWWSCTTWYPDTSRFTASTGCGEDHRPVQGYLSWHSLAHNSPRKPKEKDLHHLGRSGQPPPSNSSRMKNAPSSEVVLLQIVCLWNLSVRDTDVSLVTSVKTDAHRWLLN